MISETLRTGTRLPADLALDINLHIYKDFQSGRKESNLTQTHGLFLVVTVLASSQIASLSRLLVEIFYLQTLSN